MNFCPLASMGCSFISAGRPISTVTVFTFPSSTWSFSILMPDRVSRVTAVWEVRPYSYKYLPMQRLALPHILASEPSALKMRILKSALFELPMSTRPSLPIPVCGALHSTESFSGLSMGYFRVFT